MNSASSFLASSPASHILSIKCNYHSNKNRKRPDKQSFTALQLKPPVANAASRAHLMVEGGRKEHDSPQDQQMPRSTQASSPKGPSQLSRTGSCGDRAPGQEPRYHRRSGFLRRIRDNPITKLPRGPCGSARVSRGPCGPGECSERRGRLRDERPSSGSAVV